MTKRFQILMLPKRSLDSRSNSLYYFTGNTPAMSKKMIGLGSQYAYTFVDSEGKGWGWA